MRRKKGKLEEVISKARYYDDIDLYQVSYRNFDNIITIPLKEFILLSSAFESIPISRIVEIKKRHTIVYKKIIPNSKIY
ncbi:MAG: DUF504 domain-containing protein [Thaumarchaeota archaeon]|nr:MAG: DUF504 domain-containing protein [Nitrososphaerota archaeon]